MSDLQLIYQEHSETIAEYVGDYEGLSGEIGVSADVALKLHRMHNTFLQTGAEQRIVSYGVDDFLSLNLPTRDCLLTPWLPQQGLAMVYAPRGIGKTFFALGVAYACATGGEFLNWSAETRSRVVYLDGEMPAATMQERLQAMVNVDDREGVEIGSAINNLKIVPQERQEPTMPDLATPEGQHLYDQVTAQADLIIVDNISTLCRSGVENKSDDWNVVAEWALRMRRNNKTVLFVHHAGKGGQQRGTSKREDILDVVIALRRTSDDEPGGASFEVHFEKARHLFGDAVNPFVASLAPDSGRWSLEPLEDNTYRRVIHLAGEGMSVTEIAQEIGRNKSNVSRHLKKARDNGDYIPKQSRNDANSLEVRVSK